MLNSSAFTLIELMISIALVLILILGVNQIFTYTTQAVGAGQALNAAIRDSRSAQAQFDSDLSGIVPPGTGPNDSAFMFITSQALYGFLNKADQLGDRDGNPATRDLRGSGIDGDPNVPGDQIAPYTYNLRNHRLDVLSFFSRGLFSRQTGNLGSFSDSLSSQEAWVWYGHLWLPDNSGAYTANSLPGQGTSGSNPNNYYATQMVLGRVAMLLKEKSVDSNAGVITDNYKFNQNYFNRINPYPTTANPAQDLQPLDGSTVSTDGYAMLDARGFRYDLAATSIAGFRNILQSYLTNAQNTNTWHTRLINGANFPVNGSQSSVSYRFPCNPFVAKPMDATAMAAASPYFLGGCGQFIVEFAGDYLKQDNNPADSAYGGVTGVGSDGQIDYVIVTDPVTNLPRKQILWYGLPRSTSGGAGINPQAGDVVPVAAWTGTQLNFEKVLPYSASSGGPASMSAGAQYVCAWGPYDQPPALIRITLTLNDPTGRLPEGQTYQYIFAVPPP